MFSPLPLVWYSSVDHHSSAHHVSLYAVRDLLLTIDYLPSSSSLIKFNCCRASYGSRDLSGGDRDFDSAAAIDATVSQSSAEQSTLE